jgi:hypothetical protein|tara:strand:+ start:7250 stop:7432 length:183 start_codon:yes stop_codon:yes gene_type:complete
MASKKKIIKSIESLNKQKELHQEKLHKAHEDQNYDLVDYYEDEIERFKTKIEIAKRKLEK